MIETVIALLMIIDHEIKEHRIQGSMSECLKGKRVAERQLKGVQMFNISVSNLKHKPKSTWVKKVLKL